MPAKVSPVPDGFHTVTPFLVVDDADAVIAFMQKAFKAEFVHAPLRQGGLVRHAALRIGDACVMISNASERAKAMPTMLYVYVPNVDEVYAAAIGAAAPRSCRLRTCSTAIAPAASPIPAATSGTSARTSRT